MEEKSFFQKIKEKSHIIVITIITIYLIALAVKTGSVFYKEYWVKRNLTEVSEESPDKKG
jgi:hypothetical protein